MTREGVEKAFLYSYMKDRRAAARAEPRWVRVAVGLPDEAWDVWRDEIVETVACELGAMCPFFICKDVPLVFAGASIE